jgi:type IV secretion system protein VirB5
MKKLLFLIGYQLIVVMGITHRGEASGIVHDPTSYAQQTTILQQATQQVSKATEQIQRLDNQLRQMKDQFEQGKRHYEALTGNKNFGEVHHNKGLKKSFPEQWQGLYQATQRSLSALKGLMDTVKAEEKFTGSIDDMQQHIEGRMEQAAMVDKAVGLQAYEGVQGRMKQVDNLMAEIKNTRDPKSIAELQARISIEQAYIQNEMTKLQLVSQLQRSEQQLIEQQKYRMSRRILNPKNTGMPKIK